MENIDVYAYAQDPKRITSQTKIWRLCGNGKKQLHVCSSQRVQIDGCQNNMSQDEDFHF